MLLQTWHSWPPDSTMRYIVSHILLFHHKSFSSLCPSCPTSACPPPPTAHRLWWLPALHGHVPWEWHPWGVVPAPLHFLQEQDRNSPIWGSSCTGWGPGWVTTPLHFLLASCGTLYICREVMELPCTMKNSCFFPVICVHVIYLASFVPAFAHH